MKAAYATETRLCAVMLIGCAAMGFPLLSLFNVPVLLFGIPLLFVFLFCVWGAIIFATWIVLRTLDD